MDNFIQENAVVTLVFGGAGLWASFRVSCSEDLPKPALTDAGTDNQLCFHSFKNNMHPRGKRVPA